MRNHPSFIALAVTTALGFGARSLTSPTAAAADGGKEKCFGVVEAGKNDCAANGHAGAGQTKGDTDAKEVVTVPPGTCARIVNGQAG